MLETDCDRCGQVFVSDYLYKVKITGGKNLLVCNSCLENVKKREEKVKQENEYAINKHDILRKKPFTNLFE